ncbi:phosphotransferase family protein [Tenggerimyces flavus]|uniref:Phosphotransferase family protein n=1 Tax=Tenggerimyces flavus TaxID=1708749 RepID=A0ABV7YIJ4_9ACTN|nr:aminoglycoside phosphotransferase family protein [Tenggerimyces flavus]MBM7789243.1 aminoglycoside phosphotransferase (APT) family kinase protein [Tenggerimyces flavus]
MADRLPDGAISIAARHGVPAKDVRVFPQQGEVNLTISLGENLILRIPRDDVAEQRLAKESAVIPVVQAAGVPTARLVAYDASRDLVDRPYVVLERLHGTTLGEAGHEPETNAEAYTSLGMVLANLHRLRLDELGPIAGVPEPYRFDPDPLLRTLCESGELGSAQATWLREWFDALAAVGAVHADDVLLHGDVIPSNLILDQSGRVSALLDWGCAEWGDPVRDLVDLPTRALPSILAGYRSVTPHDELAWAASAVWYQLFWALARLRKAPSTSEARTWTAPRQARFVEILRFFSGPLTSPWSELAPGG